MAEHVDPRAVADAAWQQHSKTRRGRERRPKLNGHDDHKELPTIEVRAGLRHVAADEGLSALYSAGTPFFQRDRALVRVCRIKAKTAEGQVTYTPGILPVAHPILGRELGRSASWVNVDPKGNERKIDPPKAVVEQIAGMVGHWDFPALTGVTGTPTLRPDGSLLAGEGYDDATGLVLIDAPRMPAIPDEPTQDEAAEALALLDKLLDEFPFADAVSRSVALSMLLTPVLRGALTPAVPMHLVTAPQSGTGKSYLADIASMIATNDRCPVVAACKKPEETEKRLVSAAIACRPIIALDNCSGIIEGDTLCQVTERPLLQLRPLGTSDGVIASNTYTVFANGNNVTIAGDLVRRTIQCTLDANMESPEDREFKSDPIATAKADRGLYIAACLTIARAYSCAGKPDRPRRLPSYGAWSDLVRGPIVWLGRPDPVQTMNTTRNADPVRQARVAVFTAWAEMIGTGVPLRTNEVIECANDRDLLGRTSSLWEAFIDVARAQTREPQIDSRRLGKWLAGAKDTLAGGYKLIVDDSDKKRPRWVLTRS